MSTSKGSTPQPLSPDLQKRRGAAFLRLALIEIKAGHLVDAGELLVKANRHLDPAEHPQLALLARHHSARTAFRLGQPQTAAEILAVTAPLYAASDQAMKARGRLLRLQVAEALRREIAAQPLATNDHPTDHARRAERSGR